MQLEGSHLVRATRAVVWQKLNDPAVLARCVPGVKSLEADGPDQFNASIEVALGPVKGVFKGKINLSEKTENQSMKLKLEARAPVGVVNAHGLVQLSDEDGNTRVTWSGEPQLMGTLASLGARLLGGVAQSQANQFFTKLQEEI